MKKFLLSAFVVLSFILYMLGVESKPTGRAATAVSSPAVSPDTSQNTQVYIPPSSSSSSLPPKSGYKDGIFTGAVADAYYGPFQVKVIISGGKITDVQFLQYPNDRENSIAINQEAMPLLKQEAISAQSANVDIVTGATQSSLGFQQSLQSALDQAKI